MRERTLCNAESGGRGDRARFRLTMKCVSIAAVLAVDGACAHAPPPRPAPAPIRPPYRSSIAAVLALRAELGLTDEQAKKLEEIDDQLQVANAAIRAENPHSDRARGPHRTAATDGTSPGSGRDLSGEPLPGDQGATGAMGGGHGMRTGGGRGMAGDGHRRNATGNSLDDGARRPDAAREQMDGNDVKAYLEAEALLTEGQRPRAREIAEQYREQLFEWREATRAHRKGETGDAPVQPQ